MIEQVWNTGNRSKGRTDVCPCLDWTLEILRRSVLRMSCSVPRVILLRTTYTGGAFLHL